jgi:two-component system, LytTR family, sensor kinase
VSPNRVAPIVAVVGVCLAMGAVGVLETRHVATAHGTRFLWGPVVHAVMPRWLYLAATLPAVLMLSHHMPLVPVRWSTASVHLTLFLVIAMGEAALIAWVMADGNPAIALVFSWGARWTRALYNALPLTLALYSAVTLAAWGMAEARERQHRTLRASQLQAQLQTARLATLRAQLQPHFLYNTLNGIAALVADVQPQRAVAAIEQLAELLQASLRDDDAQQVPIAEEVGLAARYLALQQMRFGDRLSFTTQVDVDAAHALVPVFLLQPVVENAVVHSLESGAATVHVALRASSTAHGIELQVENDGAPLRGMTTAGHGVGLAATRARLETAYGASATLHLETQPAGGALVRFVIPHPGQPAERPARLALVS